MSSVQGYQLLAFQWSMVIVTLFLVCLRLFVKAYYHVAAATADDDGLKRLSQVDSELTSEQKGQCIWPWQWSDYWCVLAWLFFMGQGIMDTIENKLGFFDEEGSSSSSSTEYIQALKIYYAQNTLYLFCMYSIKCAMICLYADLIPISFRKTTICLTITKWTVALSWPIGTLLILLWCQPISRNWSLDPDAICISDDAPFVVGFTIGFHFLTDIMIYILPFPLVRYLHMPLRQKIGLIVAFGVGFLCIFFAVALMVISYVSYSFSVIFLCSVFEQTWAVTLACIPSFRTLLRSKKRRSRLIGRTQNMRQSGTNPKSEASAAE